MKRTIQLLIIIMMLAVSLSVVGCTQTTKKYENEELYTIGDFVADEIAIAEITTLDIDWYNGSVEISIEGSTLTALENFEQTNQFPTSEDLQGEQSQTAEIIDASDAKMRYLIDGATLHIKYAKSEFTDTKLKKDLVITIPTSATIEKITVNTTKANVKITNLITKMLNVTTVTGNIDLNVIKSDNEITATTTIGKIEAQNCTSTTVMLTSISSALSAKSIKAGTLVFTTMTGEVNYVAGDKNPLSIISTTLSSDTNITLPATSNFILDFDSQSGTPEIEFEYEKNEKGNFVVGEIGSLMDELGSLINGNSFMIKVSSVSGGAKISKS